MKLKSSPAEESLIANALHRLGTGNACTQMGAIEALAKEVRDGAEKMAHALDHIGNALEKLAEAVEVVKGG